MLSSLPLSWESPFGCESRWPTRLPALLLLLLPSVAAADLKIKNDQPENRYMAVLVAEGSDAEGDVAFLWQIFPPFAERAESGKQLAFSGQPTNYRITLYAINWSKKVVVTATLDLVLKGGCPDDRPKLPPPEKLPNPPKETPPPPVTPPPVSPRVLVHIILPNDPTPAQAAVLKTAMNSPEWAELEKVAKTSAEKMSTADASFISAISKSGLPLPAALILTATKEGSKFHRAVPVNAAELLKAAKAVGA